MTNDQLSSNDLNHKQKYDLLERTIKYAEIIIDFSRKMPRDVISLPLINQLVRAGTSIGANYHEADEACSKKDFINKITIAKKEAKESQYWLRVIAHALPQNRNEASRLWQEAHELNLIFAAIIRKVKNKN
ncbi:MAG: four helix bundle protein [Patescibacteria group bacterium]|nr:four helix bundle protein [Patescibacteria group bacterium]